jgi:tRNA pseudouridine38-40 synthase
MILEKGGSFMLFKVAYLGEGFSGSASQPQKKTVEGELRRVLGEEGFSENITMACRTDKDVSAFCNIFSSKDSFDYCSRISSRLENIWVYSCSNRSESIRNCMKHYIYFYGGDEERTRETVSLFSGTHDFSFFSKLENRNPLRTLDVTIERGNHFLLLHFRSQGFLWGMVRRIVGAIAMVDSGTLTQKDIRAMLEGERRRHIVPAPPEYLLLADIETQIPFKNNAYVLSRMAKEFYSRFTYHRRKGTLYEEMRVLLAS